MTDLSAAARRIVELGSKATPGEWRAVPQGGSSTVLIADQPARNDLRIPPYGYRDGGEHCLAYPFLDEKGHARWDFVCFSHGDAAFIALARTHAPEIARALQRAHAVVEAAKLADNNNLSDAIVRRDIRAALAAYRAGQE